MFVDQRRMISLEYIFYQSEAQYHQISPNVGIDPNGDMLASYLYDTTSKRYGQNAFQNKPVCFEASMKDYVKTNKNLIETREDRTRVEVLLGMYRITSLGEFEKDK